MDSRLILIKTRARKRSCSQDGWVWASMALAWVVTFLATWIGYTLVVFSLGAVDCPYDLRNMVTLVRSFK